MLIFWDDAVAYGSFKNMCLLVFLCYVVLAVTLTKRPTLLHRRVRKPKFEARHISHRGGAAEMPENTMRAFRHSLQVGTDMFELDVHLTKDGEVVVCHDESLKRVCGVDINIADMNYSELPRLKRSLEIDFAPTCYMTVSNGDVTDCHVPKLEELFLTFPNTPMNIDIKMDNDELIRKVARLIESHRRETITVWGSRLERVVRKCVLVNSSIPRFAPTSAVIKVLALFYTGLLPFVHLRDSFLELPFRTQYMFPHIGQHLGARTKLLLRFLDALLLRRTLFKHLYERGVHTYFWVLNDDCMFQEAYELGATGVMTDYPTRLRDFLDKNPQYLVGSPKLRTLRNGMH